MYLFIMSFYIKLDFFSAKYSISTARQKYNNGLLIQRNHTRKYDIDLEIHYLLQQQFSSDVLKAAYN